MTNCTIADNLRKINEQRREKGLTTVVACGFTKQCTDIQNEPECSKEGLRKLYHSDRTD